ncbi:hypothetical protein V2W45_1458660 [Cenococcum geophilum]
MLELQREEPTQMVPPKEALKARVAAYKEAIAANAVAEAPLGEPGGLGKPVAIEPDDDESESHDKGAYAAFEEAIKVEDHEASYIEAL